VPGQPISEWIKSGSKPKDVKMAWINLLAGVIAGLGIIGIASLAVMIATVLYSIF
tara:strand:- start:572 stop:736 length:165 start_codon:yes stop_codon:yes gene_type:complete